jgi:hypothetical protein
MKKYRWNKDKAFNNFVVLSTGVAIGMMIYKIMNEGIAWISTIGYFG